MKLDAALGTWKGQRLVDFQSEEFAQEYIRSLAERPSDALEAPAALVDAGAREVSLTARM